MWSRVILIWVSYCSGTEKRCWLYELDLVNKLEHICEIKMRVNENHITLTVVDEKSITHWVYISLISGVIELLKVTWQPLQRVRKNTQWREMKVDGTVGEVCGCWMIFKVKVKVKRLFGITRHVHRNIISILKINSR